MLHLRNLIVVSVLLVFFVEPVAAKSIVTWTTSPAATLALTWDGSSVKSATDTNGCVSSYDTGKGKNPTPSAIPFAVAPNIISATPFTLTSTTTPASSIDVSVDYNSTALSSGAWTGTIFTGAIAPACSPATLTMTVTSAQVDAANGGETYEAQFNICAAEDSSYAKAIQACNNAAKDNGENTTVMLRVVVPEFVRIKGLADIDLGTWSGAGDHPGSSNAFCIASNSSAGVDVKLRSTNGGVGNWTLLGDTNSDPLTYQVGLTGVGAAGSVVSGTFYPITSAEGLQTLSCPANGSVITINVPASSLDDATDTSYADTIEVTISPN